MLYKYLFFFFSYLEKKCHTIGDPYISAYILVGFTLAVNVFAAGDIAGQPYQYIKSAGQGNVAALSSRIR